MRGAVRFLVCLLISGSMAFAALPARTMAPQTGKVSCCAKIMKGDVAADGCARHAPKTDPEKQCCSGCVFCLATILSSSTPHVYPTTGEESFALFTVRELVRSDRPPVPPPRG
jgi:hypothetical protein